MPRAIFDAGALIALDRGRALVRNYVLLATQGALTLATSSAVVAQVWRGGARQARLARLLRSEVMREIPLDEDASRKIGALAARTRAVDVVDGHIAVLVDDDDDAFVVTSDPDDLARWGVPRSRIVRC